METALPELKHRLARLTDLRRTEAVLAWDMQVFMPPGGTPTRAAQLGTLEELIHERMSDDRFGELFEELEPYAESIPHDSDDASLIRVARYDWDRTRRVPIELAVEFAETAAESYDVWVRARQDSDFAAFRPWLERIIDLRRRYIECFAPYDDAYDVLLERFDHDRDRIEKETIRNLVNLEDADRRATLGAMFAIEQKRFAADLPKLRRLPHLVMYE